MLLSAGAGFPQDSQHAGDGAFNVRSCAQPGNEEEPSLRSGVQLSARRFAAAYEAHVKTPKVQGEPFKEGVIFIPAALWPDRPISAQLIGEIGHDAAPDSRAKRTHQQYAHQIAGHVNSPLSLSPMARTLVTSPARSQFLRQNSKERVFIPLPQGRVLRIVGSQEVLEDPGTD